MLHSHRSASRRLLAAALFALIGASAQSSPPQLLPERSASKVAHVPRVQPSRQGKASPGIFPSNQPAYVPAMSSDGRYVAYLAAATNIAENDTNNEADIILADLVSGGSQRVNISTGGAQANALSHNPAVSGNGSVVAFESNASNLVSGDSNAVRDIFVRDVAAAVTRRASLSATGVQANANSQTPALSSDGRYVAFVSSASNLVAGDNNSAADIFRKDMVSGAVIRATAAGADPNGAVQDYPSISGSGRYIAFASSSSNLVAGDSNAASDVFVLDADTGATIRVSSSAGASANAASGNPAISSDGRFVVFESSASNLVAADTNASSDIFLWDRNDGSLRRLSLRVGGGQATGNSFKPSISADGTYVSFYSAASLVADDDNAANDIYLLELGTGNLRLITRYDGSFPVGVSEFYDSIFGRPRVANGGTRVAFNSWASYTDGDNRGWGQIYAFDKSSGRVSLVSRGRTGNGLDGISYQLSINADGRVLAFVSEAFNLVASGDSSIGPDIYIRNLSARSTVLASVDSSGQALNQTYSVALSDSGQLIAFGSYGFGFAPYIGDFRVFVRNTASGQVTPVSVSSAGVYANGGCGGFGFSGDERSVVFVCNGLTDNLVAGDTNHASDVFVRSLDSQTTVRASVSSSGVGGNGFSDEPSTSYDGRYVVFVSNSTNLVAGDGNSQSDVFVRDMAAGSTTRVSVGTGGVEGNGYSTTAMGAYFAGRRVISDGGRFVVFVSNSTNFAAGVPTSINNVFVADRLTGRLDLISRGPGSGAHDGSVGEPSISGDGRYIVFSSDATNLISGDTNESRDVFLYDRITSQLTRVSLTAAGGQANGASKGPVISRDGTTIAFVSDANNLVAGDDNAATDAFVIDRRTLNIERASLRLGAPNSSELSKRAPVSSADGTVTVLTASRSSATGGGGAAAKDLASLVNSPMLYDWIQQKLTRLDLFGNGTAANGTTTNASVSSTGNLATFTSNTTDLLPGDTSGLANVYLRDVRSGSVRRVSVANSGATADAPSGRSAVAEIANGSRVAFESTADNLVASDLNGNQDIFVATANGSAQSLVRASGDCGSAVHANGSSSEPAISASGRFVAYSSTASNLVANDGNGASDVFICDLTTMRTSSVSRGANGASGHAALASPVDPSAWIVAFESSADSLSASDANDVSDIYVATSAGDMQLVSKGLDGRAANGASGNPSISVDGRYVSYVSSATNLVAGDTNFQPDVFVFDRQTGLTTRTNTGGATQADDVSLNTDVAVVSGQPQVIWDSAASNLVGATNDGSFNIYKKPALDPGSPLFIAVSALTRNMQMYDSKHPGHGIDFARVVNNVYFMIFYTYDANGAPEWYIAIGPMLNGVFSPTRNAAGSSLVRYKYVAGANPPQQADASIQGDVRIDFNNSRTNPACNDGRVLSANDPIGVMTWTLGSDRDIAWCMQPLLPESIRPTPDFTGTWYSGTADSGWGFSFGSYQPATPANKGLFGLVYFPDASGFGRWAYLQTDSFTNGATLSLKQRRGYCRRCAAPGGAFTDIDAGTIRLTLLQAKQEDVGVGNRVTFSVDFKDSPFGNFRRTDSSLTLLSVPAGQ